MESRALEYLTLLMGISLGASTWALALPSLNQTVIEGNVFSGIHRYCLQDVYACFRGGAADLRVTFSVELVRISACIEA
ncbi:hypothetical protein HOLleu_30255 [Holothuria leucospilota]|uniref:Uncharacterized protein n=1 Tax=Holothuria leucospilota TaxID=206669 RepID=A0A9Q1BK56_HOLLE|nr:hypothetical protein HOLleu_30255 [Holothuria leucospilota]